MANLRLNVDLWDGTADGDVEHHRFTWGTLLPNALWQMFGAGAGCCTIFKLGPRQLAATIEKMTAVARHHGHTVIVYRNDLKSVK